MSRSICGKLSSPRILTLTNREYDQDGDEIDKVVLVEGIVPVTARVIRGFHGGPNASYHARKHWNASHHTDNFLLEDSLLLFVIGEERGAVPM